MVLRAPRRGFLKTRALLAGGLVFGCGASMTVAAWTDAEQTTAEFSAGTFAIEASIDGQWGSSREMTFNSAGMFPGTVVAAPVFVRTTPDSTTAGLLRLTGNGASGGAAGIAGQLQYRVTATTLTPTQIAAFSCPNAPGSEGAYVLGTSTTWVALSNIQQAATSQEASSEAGNVIAYCFEVRLSPDAPSDVQGTSTEHTWVWDAQSLSEVGAR